jgi:hypothetical protein
VELALPKFAVRADEVDGVSDRLELALGLSLEKRDSAFWGEYRLCEIDGVELRVSANLDPMYLEGKDDPKNEFFEPLFKEYGVLVSFDGSPEAVESVRIALQSIGCGVFEVR